MNTQVIEEYVHDFFAEWEEPFFSGDDVDYHTIWFLDHYFTESKLGKEYGYSPKDALRNLLLTYMTNECGWNDPREGE